MFIILLRSLNESQIYLVRYEDLTSLEEATREATTARLAEFLGIPKALKYNFYYIKKLLFWLNLN
jgi:hypothetical protein